ncbi:MAG: hypothetical protein LEGION0398_MBIBDBAK_01184 [Legionellaceae bacterium]
MPYSPLSPFSPISSPVSPSPEDIARESKRSEKIISTIAFLKKYPNDNLFIKELSRIIQTYDISKDKRYSIASEISEIIESTSSPTIAIRTLLRDVFDSEKGLYKMLNYQRNFIPVTFGGTVSSLSFNFSRSLQSVQSAAIKEFFIDGKYNLLKLDKENTSIQSEQEDLTINTMVRR